ncbi:hypothetical protein [Roseospirillum parvum]|uniref:LTXXQ motif family protein n=1 Tax=Roseospirillum parvum TaxID=83401 RepID=A0A1G8FST4_9PROT|nr:hypothetical protein [Roseospirillum parvum]SDH85006.1 hypothetical protein SAMN05421742_1165 [Roseospirillum parvum]
MKTRSKLTLATTALATVLVAGLTFAEPAEARGCGGYPGGGPGMAGGPGMNGGPGAGWQRMDPADQKAFQEMQAARTEMRQSHQAEIKALLERMPQNLKDDYNAMMERHQADRDAMRQRMMDMRTDMWGNQSRGLPDKLN